MLRDGSTQDQWDDAAAPQQFSVQLCFDRRERSERFDRPARSNDANSNIAAGCQLMRQRDDFDLIASAQSQRVRSHASWQAQGQDAHADQIGSMDSFEAHRQHGADAEQALALCRPVAR